MALKTRGDARLIMQSTETDNYPHNTRLSDFRRAALAVCIAPDTLKPKTFASYVENGQHVMEAWG